MSVAKNFAKLSVAASALLLAVQPASADVKAGVDAWSRGQYEQAVKEWREPALAGNADAQFNLGQAYKLGRGVTVDLNTALNWYQKAAAQGHLQAADSVGHLLHYQGRIRDALPYLQASSARGEPRAQYLLGTELFNGVHTPKDWVRAYALMTRASSAGMSAASRSLSQMDKYIPLEQRQQGTVLAGQLEQQASKIRSQQVAGFPINTSPAPSVGQPVQLPPSQPAPASSAPGFPSNIPANGRPAPAPTQPAIRRVPVRPAPAPVATSGNWRIQLGAFGQEANARNLWTRLEGRMSELAALQPYLKAAGNITRLQAGPFATRSSAEAMCSKVKATGQACIVVRK